nr:MAG TPA: hypothetical protein [Caudoviricetes sp.]
MYYISIRQRGKPQRHGVQGFRLPPTFSLLWTLGPNPFYSLECPFLFLLSFLSGHSETPLGNTGGVFLLYLRRKTHILCCRVLQPAGWRCVNILNKHTISFE